MADFDNTNKGALFQAKEKKTDKHPDYDGTINVDGHDYWVSGWKKVSKNGNTFLSLSVKRKDGTSARPGQSEAKAVKDAFGLDDLPATKTRGFDADFKDDLPF
jgi:hypothetical protein